MDQLKEQLAGVLKYGFWIASSIILLGAVGIWFMTTSELSSEADSNRSAVESKVQTVNSIKQELATHPNALSHERMETLIDGRKNEVLEAWTTLYDRQRQILVWPEEELRKDFTDEFKDLLPIEVFVDYPPAEEKEQTLRARYERYIENVLPDIAEIAQAEWTATFGGGMGGMGGMMGGMGGMMGGMGGMMGGMGSMMGPGPGSMGPAGGRGGNSRTGITGNPDGPLVQWPQASQQAVLADLFPWQGRTPTTLEIYYSQENIWILRQLLQIVADVNGDARIPENAKIGEIKRIAIGSSVMFDAGAIDGVAAAAGDGGMSAMMGAGMGAAAAAAAGGGGGGSGGGGMMMGMGGMSAEAADPAENRYVTRDLEPIKATELRSALTSNQPKDVSLAVAKRVPVMMSVKINQYAVPEFLAACGSAKLMVEVQQVRVLPPDATGAPTGGAGGMMGMGGGGPPGMSGGGGGRGGGGGKGGGMGMSGPGSMGPGSMGPGSMGPGGPMGMNGPGGMGMGGPGAADSDRPLDVTAEVYGLIYIYNPPDPEKLGIEKVTEDTDVEAIEAGDAGAVDEPSGEDPTGAADPAADQDPADSTEAATPPSGDAPTPDDPSANPDAGESDLAPADADAAAAS